MHRCNSICENENRKYGLALHHIRENLYAFHFIWFKIQYLYRILSLDQRKNDEEKYPLDTDLV